MLGPGGRRCNVLRSGLSGFGKSSLCFMNKLPDGQVSVTFSKPRLPMGESQH